MKIILNIHLLNGNGNIMAIYTGTTMTEVPVYGSGRLGTYTVSNSSYAYELRDNVGSVRVVLSGTKATGNQAVVTNWDDYYPFGSIAQSGTTGSTYRYDYQGLYAQKDNITNWNDFELRMYDAKVGRWLSMDPKKVGNSPYEGMGNDPASMFDKDGGQPDDDILLNSNGKPIATIFNDLPNRYFMESDGGNWTWTTTATDGTTSNISAIRVLDPESITGDPRENERSGSPNGASFNGVLNESFTPQKQLNIISNAIKNINGYSDVIEQSNRGSLDFKPLFKAGELIDLNGIYMNNHEALNYLWGSAMSVINSSGKTFGGITVDQALSGAGLYNEYDFIFGHSETWSNQPNHDEAIVRGYLNNSMGTIYGISRDKQVSNILLMFNLSGLGIDN